MKKPPTVAGGGGAMLASLGLDIKFGDWMLLEMCPTRDDSMTKRLIDSFLLPEKAHRFPTLAARKVATRGVAELKELDFHCSLNFGIRLSTWL